MHTINCLVNRVNEGLALFYEWMYVCCQGNVPLDYFFSSRVNKQNLIVML